MALFLRGLCLLAGYLLGGFLTAEVVARCTAGVSARDIGTGNPGMANIATHLGKKAGLLVLAGDVIKTAAACWFCHQLAPELGLTALLYGGLGAVLGHNWPIWYKGRGGKGVAVTCAWLMLYLPVTGVLCGGRRGCAADRLSAGRRGADCRAGCAGGLAAIRHRGRCCIGPECRYHGHAALGRSAADTSRRGAAVLPPEALI